MNYFEAWKAEKERKTGRKERKRCQEEIKIRREKWKIEDFLLN